MRILACADIHLGRKPELAQSGHAAWDAIIQKALELAVDVVVLAGDVVEHERTWLSVYGPLLSGLETLKNAGIQVIGVGGNHDWSVFPRLAEESEAIKILGLKGTWESYDIGDIRFIGWSFPSTHEEQSPLADFDTSLVDDSKLSLGLLHAGLDSAVLQICSHQRTCIVENRYSSLDAWTYPWRRKTGDFHCLLLWLPLCARRERNRCTWSLSSGNRTRPHMEGSTVYSLLSLPV